MMMSLKQGIVVSHAIAITLLCLTVMSWQTQAPKESPLTDPSPHADMGLFSGWMSRSTALTSAVAS